MRNCSVRQGDTEIFYYKCLDRALNVTVSCTLKMAKAIALDIGTGFSKNIKSKETYKCATRHEELFYTWPGRKHIYYRRLKISSSSLH